MNNLTEFQYQGSQVRTQLDESGEPLFCLADICKVLELSNPSAVAKQVAEEFAEGDKVPNLNLDSLKTISVDTGYGIKDLIFITEPQLYFVLYRSRSERAKPFRRWVDTEVLPTIRKTGSYGTPQVSRDPLLVDLEAAKLLFSTAGLEGNQLVLAMDKVYKHSTGMSLLAKGGVQLTNPKNSQLCTPTELGKEMGLSAQDFNKLLEAHHLQARIGGKWEPTDAGRDAGAAVLDTGKRHSDGTPVTQLKWPVNILNQLGVKYVYQ